MTRVVKFEAAWDDEAQVWWASADEDDVGIATEAPTIEALRERLKLIVPDVLETTDEVRIELHVSISDTVKAA
jgi:hypothetical protein